MNYDAISSIVKFNEISGNDRKKRSINDPSVDAQFDFIEEEFEELNEAMQHNDLVGTLDACADVIVTTVGLIHKLGYDPNEVMQIVNDCNMSKFVSTKQEADASIDAYDQDERYSDVHVNWHPIYRGGDQFTEIGIVQGKKNGVEGWKILKGINTQKPEYLLNSLIDED